MTVKRQLDLVERDWYENDFIPTVQQRGAAIIKARGASSAASAASSAIDHMHDWALGSKGIVSMAIPSDGSYGIEEGIIYSYPVRCQGGKYEIVQGFELDEFSKEKMKAEPRKNCVKNVQRLSICSARHVNCRSLISELPVIRKPHKPSLWGFLLAADSVSLVPYFERTLPHATVNAIELTVCTRCKSHPRITAQSRRLIMRHWRSSATLAQGVIGVDGHRVFYLFKQGKVVV